MNFLKRLLIAFRLPLAGFVYGAVWGTATSPIYASPFYTLNYYVGLFGGSILLALALNDLRFYELKEFVKAGWEFIKETVERLSKLQRRK